MKSASFSTLGGIITAIAASLCCIGPALVTLIGIGSIGAFSAFESFRPYLVGITALILGLAFYLTYHKRQVKCEDGTCRAESPSKWNKIGVWSATFLAALAVAFPHLGVVSSSSSNPAVSGKAIVTLNIEGMDCIACAKGVEGSLASIMGVRKANVVFEQRKAVIEYDPAIVQPQAFLDRVNKDGFTARIPDQRKGE